MAYERTTSTLISRSGYSGVGAFDDSTDCMSVPVGDPYRTPGHWCMYQGEMLQFDAAGQLHTSAGVLVPKPPTSLIPGVSDTTLLIGAGVAAFFLLRGRK